MSAMLKPAKTFQSTLPARGATASCCWLSPFESHFNPRSPHGERRSRKFCLRFGSHFNPRSPHGERRCQEVCNVFTRNFNPRSPHGERRRSNRRTDRGTISIHAPRTGSDEHLRKHDRADGISIHAPRTGSDTPSATRAFGTYRFQSTLPARGATRAGADASAGRREDFNPRSPHGERPQGSARRRARFADFNPRSPHGERRGTLWQEN